MLLVIEYRCPPFRAVNPTKPEDKIKDALIGQLVEHYVHYSDSETRELKERRAMSPSLGIPVGFASSKQYIIK